MSSVESGKGPDLHRGAHQPPIGEQCLNLRRLHRVAWARVYLTVSYLMHSAYACGMNEFLPSIDAGSAVPPFKQLHEAVIDAVSSGELVPGAKLPTVRGLAPSLNLATNTVASAYRSLEAAGVVEGRGRAGTFVTLGDDPIEAGARTIALDAVDALRGLGFDRARAVRLIGEAYDA